MFLVGEQAPQQQSVKQLTGLTGYGGHTYSNDPSGHYGPIATNLDQVTIRLCTIFILPSEFLMSLLGCFAV
jgi:hypothetical protein